MQIQANPQFLALTRRRLAWVALLQLGLGCSEQPRPDPPSPAGALTSATPGAGGGEGADAPQADEELDPSIWRARPKAPKPDDVPGERASREQLKSFILSHPEHKQRAELAARHDALLAPCIPEELVPVGGKAGGRVASCNPEHVLLAEGMLDRADRYLAECIDCKDAFMVKALRSRMRSVAPTERRDLAFQRLDAALATRDVDAAQQAIADHTYLGEAFVSYATRKLKRRFKPQELAGDLGDASCAVPGPQGSGTAVFFSPEQPEPDEPFRVMVVSEVPREAATLKLSTSAGESRPLSLLKHDGGPPYFWFAEGRLPRGRFRVELVRSSERLLCQRFDVRPPIGQRSQSEGEIWPSRRGWDRDHENLYSAWISVLFDAPEATTWRGFHSVTQERPRNFLFNHLGLGEDAPNGVNSVSMTPDCADGPHFFRAYFAWKLGLPFGYHRCRFGSASGAPRCADWTTNQGVAPPPEEAAGPAGARRRAGKPPSAKPPNAKPPNAKPPSAKPPSASARLQPSALPKLSAPTPGAPAAATSASPVATPTPAQADAGPSGDAGPELELSRTPERKVPFIRLEEPRDPPGRELTRFLSLVKNEITARSLRTDFTDDETDLYPLPLTRDALRPGSVYSDPYGHTYTLVRWLPQSKDSAGVLLAVDAQPDETINIKRFWRGNFLFSALGKIDGHGFKAFRPIVLHKVEDKAKPRAAPLSNWEIAVARGYGNFSTEQDQLDAPGFYGQMELLINPDPLSPVLAYKELHRALHRQLRQRVKEIELAQEYARRNPGELIDMPQGQAIFRTTGPWEALSTPCRDLRLLVGIDALRDFPEQVIRVAPEPKLLRAHLARLHQRWSRELRFRYRRSDGSEQRLTLEDALQRAVELELGWNPNDCPERRWGAPAGSEEAKTCTARAPEEQQRRMDAFRHWFARRYSCG